MLHLCQHSGVQPLGQSSSSFDYTFHLSFSLFTFLTDQHSFPTCKCSFSVFLFSVFSAVVSLLLGLLKLLWVYEGTQLELLRVHKPGFTAGSTGSGALMNPVAFLQLLLQHVKQDMKWILFPQKSIRFPCIQHGIWRAYS